MSVGFAGKDGFAWFFGVVEDRMDPLEIGRVRVRVFGYHSENTFELPTNQLPWATVIQPPTSANFSGKGFSSVGLLEGTWVFGFFADTNSYQVPVVIGAISGLNSQEFKKELNENYGSGFRDTRKGADFKGSGNGFPTEITSRLYPQGTNALGSIGSRATHGAQLGEQSITESWPRKSYRAGANKKKEGTPDTNILALNDKTRINETIVALKTTERESGGLLDVRIPVADIEIPEFTTGVIGLSLANFGTIKGLGIPTSLGNPPVPSNAVTSSSTSSKKDSSLSYLAGPRNSNNKRIYSGYSTSDLIKQGSNAVPSASATMAIGSSAMDRVKNSMDTITNLPNSAVNSATNAAGDVVGETMGGTP